MSERRTSRIRMFGGKITVEQNNPTPTDDDQGKNIAIDDESSSRKRKTKSPVDDACFLPKKPKILRLFGVDIPVDHLLPQEDQEVIAQNPNQDEVAAELNRKMSERRKTRIRLFGVNITVDQNDSTPIDDDQAKNITIDDEASSRERKTTSPDDDGYSLPKKPKILRLFGVDIPVDHLLPQEDKEAIAQNPNQEEEEEAGAAPPHIPIMLDGNPVFLFKKELTKSDVARGHNRLLITGAERLMAALTEEERGRVELNRGEFLRVVTRDTNGDEYTLRLNKWAGSGAIVLKHQWGKLIRANGLQRGDLVKGWGYRVSGEFRLSLYIIRN